MEINNLETKADRNAQDANAKIASGQEVTELMHALGPTNAQWLRV